MNYRERLLARHRLGLSGNRPDTDEVRRVVDNPQDLADLLADLFEAVADILQAQEDDATDDSRSPNQPVR